MDYKATLLIAKTEFPMRGNLPNKEPIRRDKWNKVNMYQKSLDRTKGRPLFVLHDGPPYANGDLHAGHAFNKILKDFIVRYKSMAGFHAPYVPGWDTHGLPIETALTKQNKIDRKKLSVSKFRQMCADYAMDQINSQREQFKSMGVRADWENPYITLTNDYEAAQIKVFGEMAKKGYIYKGLKPVYWSPSSESALAEAEIEYRDKRSPAIYVTYEVKETNDLLEKGTKFVIWTTTPWTIPASMGISLHPDLTYDVVKVNDEKYVVAHDLVEPLVEELKWESPEVVQSFKGIKAEEVVAKHPFYERNILVTLGTHVTTDVGTGCVHMAPGHGEDDFYVAQKYGIDALCPVDERGFLTDEAPGFSGIFYDDANKAVTEKLSANNALLSLKFVTHSYPHDWRTKQPTIFRATAQWFASIKDFRKNILDEIKEVNWTPHWGETRLYNMVRDREDWCISRQRTWGVPIPVFYGENNEPIITDETVEHISKLFLEHGSNVWFEREAKDLLPEGFTSVHSPSGTFTKETDIMDVWFDSGSSHEAVLMNLEDHTRPADLYLEGSDQYRGWFNSSLSTSVAITGKTPYKNVVSHGFVLDGDGHKMSKSQGNAILPSNIQKQLGTDILRLWVSTVDYHTDVRISDPILKQVSENYRKMRNTFRFMLANLTDFDPKINSVAETELEEVDVYMLHRLQSLVKNVKENYENYEFSSVFQDMLNYITVDLSAFYLDFAKDVLYIESADNNRRRSIQTVFYETLTSMVQLLSPILPHTAEEVWEEIKGVEADYVQLTDMPEFRVIPGVDRAFSTKWNHFMKVRSDVLKALEEARDEKVIGKPLEAKIIIEAKDDYTKEVLEVIPHIHQLFIVSEAEINQTHSAAKEYKHVLIHVEKHEGEKCERCWTYSKTVGKVTKHPTVCKRCADIVDEHYPEVN